MASVPDKRRQVGGQLMGVTAGTADIPMPFGREIFLLRVDVAGTAYYDIKSVAETLEVGQELVLKREPDNPHDALAIEILTLGQMKLGYVPRADNPVLARLMDAGKTLSARLAGCGSQDEAAEGWIEASLDISLKDL